MRVLLIAVLVTGALSDAAGAESAGSPAHFYFESSRNDFRNFSSDDSQDHLIAEVDGATCEDAVFRVRVENVDEAELYRFEAPFSRFVEGDCRPERATALLEGENLRLQPELLPRPSAPGDGERGFELLVSGDTYRRLRSGDAPRMVLKHPIGPGEVRYVVFDRKEAKPVAVLRVTDALEQAELRRREALRAPGIGFRDSAHVAFSSDAETDLLEISLLGDSCQKLSLKVRVTDPRGRELYRHESPFTFGGDCVWGELADRVEFFFEYLGIERSGTLLPYPGETEGAGDLAVVPEETYERLRAANRPTLKSYVDDSYATLIYDPESATGVVVAVSHD